MPPPKHLLAKFQEISFYHVICKSIGEKRLFLNDENKRYFLERYQQLLGNFVDTYTYCLLDNHVHWLIKTNPEKDIHLFLTNLPSAELTTTHKKFLQQTCSFHELIEQQFNRLFIAYSLSFNKRNNISGHLFNRPFKRIKIKDNGHLTQLFVYIHANVMKHGIATDFTAHRWSSYQAIISKQPTHIKRLEVLEWFGGREQFITAHREMADFYYGHEFSGE